MPYIWLYYDINFKNNKILKIIVNMSLNLNVEWTYNNKKRERNKNKICSYFWSIWLQGHWLVTGSCLNVRVYELVSSRRKWRSEQLVIWDRCLENNCLPRKLLWTVRSRGEFTQEGESDKIERMFVHLTCSCENSVPERRESTFLETCCYVKLKDRK